jgi:hypothetical protein
MCEPEVLEMLDKVDYCLISYYAYKVKPGARDIGNLKYWTNSAGEHETGEQDSKNALTFPSHRLAKLRWRLQWT